MSNKILISHFLYHRKGFHFTKKKNFEKKRGFLLILLTAWNFRSDNEIQLMQLFKYVFFFQFYPKSQ